MRLLIDPRFGGPVADAFRGAGHDVAAMPARLPAALDRAVKESRLLVTSTDILPRLVQEDSHEIGAILLEGDAASAAGVRKVVLPILAGLQQRQLVNVLTLISDNSLRRLNYLNYENGRQVARVVVPADCSEMFLHAGVESRQELATFGIVLAGISRVTPFYEVFRERADFHLFALVASGALEVSSEAGAQRVGPEEVLIIPSGTRCHYRSSEETEFLWFHLTPQMVGDAGRDGRIHVTPALAPGALMTYARQYRDEASNLFADSDAALLPLATLMEQMIRRHLAGLGVPRREREGRRSLQKVLVALRGGPAVWSVPDLAKACGLSIPHLHRLTKKVLNKTPHELIQEARMQRACDALIHTESKLEHLAAITGYSDAFSFSRAFKQHAGMSPQDYRETHRIPISLVPAAAGRRARACK